MRNPSSASSSPEQRDVGLDDRVVSSLSKTKAMVALCSKLVGMKRGPWTPEEDELLSSYINREGHGRWRTLPKRASLLRCGKSCRLRWMNYLRPSVKHGHIAPDEEDLILRLLGNRWSLIAGRLPGRTDNEIKNYWNAHLSKKLIRQGIDPRTHRQLLSSSLDRNTITTAADPHNSITINNTNIDNQYVDSYSEHRSNNLNLSTVSTVDLYQVPTRENKDFQGYLGAMPLHNHKSRAKGKGHLSKEEDDASVDVEGDDNDAEEVKTYADDDVFSLFLSSVINYEELLKGVGGQQQQHDEHEPAGNIAMIPAVRSTSLQAFASSGTGWDAPMMHGFF